MIYELMGAYFHITERKWGEEFPKVTSGIASCRKHVGIC